MGGYLSLRRHAAWATACALLPTTAFASDIGAGGGTLLVGIPAMALSLLLLSVIACFRRVHALIFGGAILVFAFAALIAWTLRTDAPSLLGGPLTAAFWAYYGLFAGVVVCFATIVIRQYRAEY